jgi:hypothetical protein
VASLPTGRVTPQQMSAALANMNVNLTQRMLEIASSAQPRGPDGAPLKDLLADIPELRDVVEGGDAESGKQAMGVVAYALVRLRRGDPIPAVMASVRAAAPKRAVVAAPPPAPAPSVAPPPPKPSVAERLKNLDELRRQAVVSEEEYRRERQRILEEGL